MKNGFQFLVLAMMTLSAVPSFARENQTPYLSCSAVAIEKLLEKQCIYCGPNAAVSFELKSQTQVTKANGKLVYRFVYDITDDDMMTWTGVTADIAVKPVDALGPVDLCDLASELK